MPEKLAEAHWTYIKELLIKHNEERKLIDLLEFHYKSAFLHGYKHGKSEAVAP